METPYTVCSIVLAYVRDALDKAGRGVGVATVAVGALVVDDCCDGILAVAPERIYQTTDPFPYELIAMEARHGLRVCEEAPIAVDVSVALFRCVPVLNKAGNGPPDQDVVEGVYAEVLRDAAIVWGVVNGRELLGDDGTGEPVWLAARLSQTFTPAEGGCVGIETHVTLGVGQTGWCL